MTNTNELPSVAIIGTGYVGLTTAACLAHLGAEWSPIDVDEAKIATLRDGVIPIVEHALDTIVHDAVAAGNLRFESAATLRCATRTSCSSASRRHRTTTGRPTSAT
jgi:UDP-glucose 6-dehydrogenase